MFLNFFEPLFAHLSNRDNDTKVADQQNGQTFMKYLAQRKCIINIMAIIIKF